MDHRLSLEGIFGVCFWNQRGLPSVGYLWNMIETEIVFPFPFCKLIYLNMDPTVCSLLSMLRDLKTLGEPEKDNVSE